MSKFILGAAIVAGLSTLLSTPAFGEDGTDYSETNPLKIHRSAGFSNEYLLSPSRKHTNVAKAEGTLPLLNGRASVKVGIPFVTSNITGPYKSGIGDCEVKLSYIVSSCEDRCEGIVAGLRTTWDTASNDLIGAGKNVVGPSVTWVKKLGEKQLFAPSYEHLVSVGGSSKFSDISTGLLSLKYVIYLQDSWVVVDPILVTDYEDSGHSSAIVGVTFGRTLGKMNGGTGQIYIKPSVAMGGYRAYDYGVEIGFKIVGF